ncbi:MAG: hypothetical protein A2622_08955 [Bdellovibrionales bacterium RIFCSPHIGHO2_01_FULL_40_29]|nr:MAG: hypothetical protein A2622_08955 [Bdellovibrionales bacterium RIFCSPHIGHO2_01_FULL_40_29]OFZ32865.1 MAG: hypothetical protein A3D17_09165 [Bdellovibrionales bacterium RIFCSPHIGHO2_02_FULL_40_15]
MIRIYALLFVVLFCFTALAAQLTVEEKTLDFQQLIGRIKASYGPLEYKKESLGIDIDVLQAHYLRQIQESKSNTEFYYLIAQFVAEFQDSHFAAILPSNKSSVLPFTVEWIQGKVYIDEVTKSLMDSEKFPFKKGDELISIGGIATADLLKEIMPYIGEGNDKTLKHLATWMLTSRSSARLPTLSGATTVEVQPTGKTEILSHQFEWIIKGEDPIEMGHPSVSFFNKISIHDKIATMIGNEINTERKFICSGDSRITIPENATVISKTPFVSYYYPTTKGPIGYVRIPHYAPRGTDARLGIEQYISQYTKVISIMEQNTVGLVIDQDHNCGGYVELVNRMVGLFMDKPYHPMYFKLVANKENYLDYQKFTNETDKLTTWYDNAMKVLTLLKDFWQRGERTTSFTTLDGEEWAQPNLVRYTKPVVMLIDEMSGSGGDAFPSLMQGYGRAKLIGSRTMGAGGHVTQNSPLNYSQITVSMTRSLFFRPDGVPVENNGAAPDYPYEITLEDFMGGYKNYRAFYEAKLLEMVQVAK